MNKRTEAQALAAELESISSPDVSKMYQPERGTLIRSADMVVRQDALLWKALDVLGRTDSEPGSRAWERESELIAIIREHLGTKPAIPEKPSFDLDAACKEALDRVRNSIHADAHNHRVMVKLGFDETHRKMLERHIYQGVSEGMRKAIEIAREMKWRQTLDTVNLQSLVRKPPQNYILQTLDDPESS